MGKESGIKTPTHADLVRMDKKRKVKKLSAVYANRTRLQSKIGKAAMRKRGEVVERSFQHVLDRGGQRRTQVRGLENVQKKYRLAVAGFNLGLLLRKVLGVGTPKRFADGLVGVFCNLGDGTLWLLCFLASDSTENASASWFWNCCQISEKLRF